MKSQDKVKRQRRIKNIPILQWGFRMRGLMNHGLLSDNPTTRANRLRTKVQKRSRKINRGI